MYSTKLPLYQGIFFKLFSSLKIKDIFTFFQITGRFDYRLSNFFFFSNATLLQNMGCWRKHFNLNWSHKFYSAHYSIYWSLCWKSFTIMFKNKSVHSKAKISTTINFKNRVYGGNPGFPRLSLKQPSKVVIFIVFFLSIHVYMILTTDNTPLKIFFYVIRHEAKPPAWLQDL